MTSRDAVYSPSMSSGTISHAEREHAALPDAAISSAISDLEQLCENAPLGMAVLDQELRFVRVNAWFAAMDGWTIHRHPTRTLAEALPQLAGQIDPLCRRILQGGQAVMKVEVRGEMPAAPHRQGTWLVNCCPLHDGGHVQRIGLMIEDITAVREAERRLRESVELREEMVASVHDAMAAIDREGFVLAANQAWVHSPAEAGALGVRVGANCMHACQRECEAGSPFAQAVLAGLESVLDGSSPRFELELACGNSADRRWRRMTVTPLGRPEGGAVISHLDITAQKRIEHLQSDLEQQLRLEKLCAALALRLIGASGRDFDGSVAPALRELAEFFGVEQCSLLRVDGAQSRVTHACADEGRQWPAEDAIAGQLGWYTDMLRAGEVVRADAQRLGGIMGAPASHVCVPLGDDGAVMGGLALSCFSAGRAWPESLVNSLRRMAGFFAELVARVRAEAKAPPQDAGREAADHRRTAAHVAGRHDRIIGQSDAVREVLARAEQVAATDSTVLILGETGTGKELIARAIHDASARRGRPMVKVNCAALPSALVESELFGREKGAYTGALSKQIGRFELADESTILLDEIGDLPLELQGKLLRVLQEGEFERLGSPRTVRVNTRVIAATHCDLRKAVEEGTFREDLYYRLNVFTIPVPPLREHPEDIPLLVWAFVRQFGESMSKAIDTIPRPVMEAMQRFPWPGNVRQLRNVIEHAMIISTGNTLRVEMPQTDAGKGDDEAAPMTLQDVERSHILGVLEKTRWKVSGKGGAAEFLGLKPTTLESRMERLGIRRPQ